MDQINADTWIVSVLAVINIIAFILYGVDKHRARHQRWRISEKTLIGVAVFGGSVGAILGMYFFHHKTKHWYFRYGLPVILIVQVALAWMLCRTCRTM